MRIVEYERLGVDITTLPISKLRSIDIQTVDEEKLIAKLIAEKGGNSVPHEKVFIDDIKAKMDKEITQRTLTRDKELEYQREIDARRAIIDQPKPATTLTDAVKVNIEPKEPEETLADKIEKLKNK